MDSPEGRSRLRSRRGTSLRPCAVSAVGAFRVGNLSQPTLSSIGRQWSSSHISILWSRSASSLPRTSSQPPVSGTLCLRELPFRCPHGIDGLAQPLHDAEPVQHMPHLARLLPRHPQLGLPPVRADNLQQRSALLAEPLEEALRGRDPAVLPDPQQLPSARVQLVHQGQVNIQEINSTSLHSMCGNEVYDNRSR